MKMKNAKRIIAVIAFIFAIILTVVALFLPPKGQIDSSVTLIVAQFLVLAATLLGVDSYFTRIQEMVIHGAK